MKVKQKRNRRGFTLVEIMVVIVILGILAGLVATNVVGFVSKARVTAAKNQIKTFEEAIDRFKMDTSRYPDQQMGLQALVDDPGLPGWDKSGYLKNRELPNDPWGIPYEYRTPGTYGPYDIISLGADGQEGGDGEDADIFSFDLSNSGTPDQPNNNNNNNLNPTVPANPTPPAAPVNP